MGSDLLLVLAGDVMTGRGIDQILPAPGSPRLHEEYVVDARSYVDLAEHLNGPVPRAADPSWPWGDVLTTMRDAGPAVRVMNLETSVTTSDEIATGKGIHYRMNPANLDVLRAADVDVWSLANNHVLDHGVPGLLETLESMHAAGLRTVGAGADEVEAWACARIPGEGRVLVTAVGHASSGVPWSWGAGPGRPGIALLPDLSDATAEKLAQTMTDDGRDRDVRVVSVHWGGNWGYRVPDDQRRFAHRLVDAGVHVVHGHSSHHPRPAEIYRGSLVLYGCGDLVNDYEGIGGYEGFRDDLRLLYLVRLDTATGGLRSLTMIPFQSRRLTLRKADPADVEWLARTLDEASRRYGTSVVVAEDGLVLRPAG
ncbi:MAG TPA: CapA family protein [Nocardioidaceae bacterium]|nr:CapA family protein [Nocardioidaceae bacterium]